MWDRIKKALGGSPSPTRGRGTKPAITRISANQNPWGVPLLDVRPVTQTMLSTSSDPRCAQNAVSYGQDDGLAFVQQSPPTPRRVSVQVAFKRDRLLADGPLFIPRVMEHKWAIYVHDSAIRFVRSWQRQVHVVARVQQAADQVTVTEIAGVFVEERESESLTAATLDYLVRSHVLGLTYPVPLPPGMDADPDAAAMWCMSAFGNLALVASCQVPARSVPDQPLRSHSLLHIAVARGDAAAVQAQLSAGVPADLLAADGLLPIQWALSRPDTAMLELLLAAGSPVDARSSEGATALMTAVQSKDGRHVDYLLAHGADVNAQDGRGFTALHRVAEMGHVALAKTLLSQGARADVVAEGHTALSFATQRSHREIVALLGG